MKFLTGSRMPAVRRERTMIERAIDAALALVRGGIPVFPCNVDKSPTTPNGFHSAVCTAKAVQHLWRVYPGPLIGVPTGASSSLDILDIDPSKDGHIWLKAERYRLPKTREHCSRSDGGLHFLFRHREGVRNSAGRIAKGVDVRGEGGFVIWWPALGLPVRNNDVLLDWPDWLIEAQKRQTQPLPSPLPAPPRGHGYAYAALRRAVEAVASAAPGTRNDVLNLEAFCLARFVESHELDQRGLANALATAARHCGLADDEIQGTLTSAFRAAGVFP